MLSAADSSRCRQQPPAELPSLQRSDSPTTLPTQQQAHVSYRRRPLAPLAASEVFHSAVDILALDGSLALAASGSFSLGRASFLGDYQRESTGFEEGVGESGTAHAAEPLSAGPAPRQSISGTAVSEPAAERAVRVLPQESAVTAVTEVPPAGSSMKVARQQVDLQPQPQEPLMIEMEQLHAPE